MENRKHTSLKDLAQALGVSLSLIHIYVQLTLAFFWLMAFSSATHDIAADGFYMLGLNNKEQSFFVGIRNTCYPVSYTHLRMIIH